MRGSRSQKAYHPPIQDREKDSSSKGYLRSGGVADYEGMVPRSPSTRFIPRKVPVAVTDARLDIVITACEYKIIDAQQYYDLHTDGSPQAIDDFHRELRALCNAQLLIRLHSDVNQPVLYKFGPLGGKVLYEAGGITERQIMKRTRLDASDVYWEHKLMRGHLRVALTKLFRANRVPLPPVPSAAR